MTYIEVKKYTINNPFTRDTIIDNIQETFGREMSVWNYFIPTPPNNRPSASDDFFVSKKIKDMINPR